MSSLIPSVRLLRARSSVTGVLVGLIAMVGCRAEHAQPDAAGRGSSEADTLAVLDTLMLQEPDTAAVSQATGFAIGSEGTLFVGDAASSRVFVYDDTGAFQRTIARKGRGPGELPSTGPMALVGDTLLVIQSGPKLHAFAAASGAYRWTKLGIAGFNIGNMMADGDMLFLAAPDPASVHAVAAIPVGAAEVAPTRIGPLPAVYLTNPQIVAGLAAVGHASRGGRDGVHVVAIEASNSLYYWRAEGAIDSIDMPVRRRRGARLDLIEGAARDMSKGIDAVYKSSLPLDVSLPSDSIAAVIHTDLDLDPKTGRFSGRVWLSMVNLATRRACTDVPLDVPPDPLPRLASRGDTLYALVQLADSVDAKAAAIRFRLPRTVRC